MFKCCSAYVFYILTNCQALNSQKLYIALRIVTIERAEGSNEKSGGNIFLPRVESAT